MNKRHRLAAGQPPPFDAFAWLAQVGICMDACALYSVSGADFPGLTPSLGSGGSQDGSTRTQKAGEGSLFGDAWLRF
jgi:hypothetical protein